MTTLERLLTTHPALARDRLDYGEGYFANPYLLWFVAENPVRSGRLPANAVEIARAIIAAARREAGAELGEQLTYALALVSSGRVPRECGVQLELIDLLVDAGAKPGGAMLGALGHRELAAVERLLARGAAVTLPVAVSTGRWDEARRLGPGAGAADRQLALMAAAFYGRADMLSFLVDLGVDINGYGPRELHPHATALHQAVDSGSLAAVRVLVEAGAALDIRDRMYQGTPCDWAEYLGRGEIAEYLRSL